MCSLFENDKLCEKEQKIEKVIVSVKNKMGLSSVIKGMNLEEGANQLVRNKLVGGHNGE